MTDSTRVKNLGVMRAGMAHRAVFYVVQCALMSACASGAMQVSTPTPTVSPMNEPQSSIAHPPAPAPSATADSIEQAWDFQNPAASERQFRALALAASDPESSSEFLTQAARAQGLQGKMAEATATLDAIEQGQKITSPALQARVALERGRVLNSSKQPDAARPYFERALEVARSAQLDSLAVDAAHMVAITYQKSPNDAIRWNEQALGLARASTDARARKWLGSLLNNQGWSYFAQGEFERALALFQEALEVRKQSPEVRPRRIADWAVARVLRALGREREALAIQQRLLAEYQGTGEQNGFVLEELAECYLALGDAQRAAPYFAQAHSELAKDPDFVSGQSERLARLARLAEKGEGHAAPVRKP